MKFLKFLLFIYLIFFPIGTQIFESQSTRNFLPGTDAAYEMNTTHDSSNHENSAFSTKFVLEHSQSLENQNVHSMLDAHPYDVQGPEQISAKKSHFEEIPQSRITSQSQSQFNTFTSQTSPLFIPMNDNFFQSIKSKIQPRKKMKFC